jgi:hypothetical protein
MFVFRIVWREASQYRFLGLVEGAQRRGVDIEQASRFPTTIHSEQTQTVSSFPQHSKNTNCA